MSIEKLQQRINLFKVVKEDLISDLKKIVIDKSIPLEERWNLFIESDLGNHDDYYHEPFGIDWNNKSLYNDFHTDRYAHLEVKDMLNRSLDNDLFETNGDILFKEYFLTKFIKSFENNW